MKAPPLEKKWSRSFAFGGKRVEDIKNRCNALDVGTPCAQSSIDCTGGDDKNARLGVKASRSLTCYLEICRGEAFHPAADEDEVGDGTRLRLRLWARERRLSC